MNIPKEYSKYIIYIYIYIYIYYIIFGIFSPTPEEVIVLPLASIASLFVDELRSRQPLNRCMKAIVIVIHNRLKFTSQLISPRG